MGNYTLEIEILSPVHIGSGKAELAYSLDYDEVGGKVYVFNQDRLLDHVLSQAARLQKPCPPSKPTTTMAAAFGKAGLTPGAEGTPHEEAIDEGELVEQLLGLTISDLAERGFLDRRRYPSPQMSPLFRYILEGRAQRAAIAEHVKDVHDRPYIPGSSLKGAIRTALAWCAFIDGGLKLEPRAMRNRSRADEAIEREIFGRSPNYDLLRSLQVSDTVPAPLSCLKLETVALYSLRDSQLRWRGPGFLLRLETLAPARSSAPRSR